MGGTSVAPPGSRRPSPRLVTPVQVRRPEGGVRESSSSTWAQGRDKEEDKEENKEEEGDDKEE